MRKGREVVRAERGKCPDREERGKNVTG